ncbi:MAG: maleylpyruvate isomerase family mycothiol-dependent enzyme [Pseudonocardia sp.]
MNVEEALPATESERRGIADLLAGLDESEWAAESLCAGWTVRDVAAHLTLATRMTMVGAVLGLVRARGNLDRLIADSAVQHARETTPDGLVAQLREHATSTRRPPGTKVWDPLVDLLVHGQDIARPLGRERAMPLDRTVGGLTHVWSTWTYGTLKRFAGLRFAATDADWSAGEGTDLVTGPASELLLLSTGRRIGLDGLTGAGVPEARRRLDA